MKWLNQDKYFSIDVMGRHSICSCSISLKEGYDKTDMPFIVVPYNERDLYKISDVSKVDVAETMYNIDNLLADTEEYYPEDTWLTLRIYNKDFEVIYEKSESCECDYDNAREIIKEFLETGEYCSEKICFADGYSYWT